MRSIGLDETMHADFGSGLWEGGPIGIPFTTVGRAQRKVRVRFEYASELDRGRYPIPPRVPIEDGARLDLGGRGRTADPARARSIRRGAARAHRPRAALHGRPAMGQRLRLKRGGAPHRGWDNDQLHTLHRVPGRVFEVVDTSRLPRPRAGRP